METLANSYRIFGRNCWVHGIDRRCTTDAFYSVHDGFDFYAVVLYLSVLWFWIKRCRILLCQSIYLWRVCRIFVLADSFLFSHDPERKYGLGWMEMDWITVGLCRCLRCAVFSGNASERGDGGNQYQQQRIDHCDYYHSGGICGKQYQLSGSEYTVQQSFRRGDVYDPDAGGPKWSGGSVCLSYPGTGASDEVWSGYASEYSGNAV